MDLRDFHRLHLGDPVRLSAGLTPHEHPTLSPDGRHLAYYAGEYGSIAVLVCDNAGRFARLASPYGGNSTQPAWHPDNQLLVFRHQHDNSSKWELWQASIKGDCSPRRLLADPAVHFKHPVFDEQGRRMAFFSDENSPGIFHLWLADVVDPQYMDCIDEHDPQRRYRWVVGVSLGERQQLTFADDRMDCHPVFSPDGKRLVYHFYRGTDENSKPPVTNLCELEIASGRITQLTEGDDQYKHPFYLDNDVITFHHEDNSTCVRRLGALHLASREVVWLSSGEKNDKHPCPWIAPKSAAPGGKAKDNNKAKDKAKGKSRADSGGSVSGEGRAWLYYSSKRQGEEEAGESSSYDIVCAELRWDGNGGGQKSEAVVSTETPSTGKGKGKGKGKDKDKAKGKGKDEAERKGKALAGKAKQRRAEELAASGRAAFERDMQGLRDGGSRGPAGKTSPEQQAALMSLVQREIKAGKWKKDNCGDCPYRYLREGRIKSIEQMRTDPRVKKKTCKTCPSRFLLAAVSKPAR